MDINLDLWVKQTHCGDTGAIIETLREMWKLNYLWREITVCYI